MNFSTFAKLVDYIKSIINSMPLGTTNEKYASLTGIKPMTFQLFQAG